MQTLRKLAVAITFGFMALVFTPQYAISATVNWSWDYGTEEPTLYYFLTSSSSFDVNIKLTNEDTSDRAVYLAPYAIPEGYYYEGFYEFQSNIDEVVNTIIQPGETSFLNIGTWVPVLDGPAPYVNIEAQPKYLEVYYFDDNGNVVTSGEESLNRMKLTIMDAFNPDPYDDNNPGQGITISWIDAPQDQDIIFIYEPPILIEPIASTPIPSSMCLLGSSLLILAYRRRTN